MVVYKEIQDGIVKAYSDRGVMIHGGSPESDYAVAYDPKSAGRTYFETAIPVPTQEVYERDDSAEPTLADYDAAMEQHLYDERAARGYTTREPDAYLNSSVPRWAQDARDWVAHRDAVMAYALTLMNQVEDGERDAPTLAEFRAGLPTIAWTHLDI